MNHAVGERHNCFVAATPASSNLRPRRSTSKACSRSFYTATHSGFPNVEVKVIEAAGRESLAMLEHGEIHLAQNLLQAIDPNDPRFVSMPLEPVELLAACHPNSTLGNGGALEVDALATQPLLVLDAEFVVRRAFDAACRLAGLKPNIRLASRAPHTLLALAEAGHGIAIIPSQLRTDRYALRIVGLTHAGSRCASRLPCCGTGAVR